MISIFTFSIRLISSLLIVFGLHVLVLNLLEYALFNNLIIRSYLVNLVIAFGIHIYDGKPCEIRTIFSVLFSCI